MLLEIWTAFWSYLVLTAPYLLIGIFASGLIHEVLTVNVVRAHLVGPGIWPVLKAAFLGVPLPLCSCSVIPAAVTMRKPHQTTTDKNSGGREYEWKMIENELEIFLLEFLLHSRSIPYYL